MESLLAQVICCHSNGGNRPAGADQAVRRGARSAGRAGGFIVAAAALCLAAIPVSGQQASQASSIPHAKCVIGCENIKANAGGTLSVLPSGLQFASGKQKAAIATASITDIFTGNESRQDVTGAAQVMSMAIPYGGSRVLSLFSHKVEVLTVEYVDSYGGFHGSIFVLPVGKATAVKEQLVAQGAKVSTHVQPPAPPQEQKP